MTLPIIIVSSIGFLLSIYAYYTERKLHSIKNYHASCDINKRISCSKAFLSKYGKLFGIPNSLLGIFFYLLIIILYVINIKIIFYLAILAFLGSIPLAYFSYLKLKTFCLVCTSIYIINILLLIFSYLAL